MIATQLGSALPEAQPDLFGAEVRRRVCAALRAREFPRAAPALALPSFDLVSGGQG